VELSELTAESLDRREHGDVAQPEGHWRRLVIAVREADDEQVEAALVDLSGRNRFLAPLTLVIGAFVMLFQGVRLLFTNWRLSLIQLLPATLIWAAMLDLKIHALKGRSFHVLRGPVLIPMVLAIAALTVGAYYLNAVFAFHVSGDRDAGFRPAFDAAARHRPRIIGWGFAIGVALGVAVLVFPRWGRGWFTIGLGIVVAVMMVTYVTVPSALVGIRTERRSPRDQLAATAVGGAVGAVVCSPPYALGRIGVIMLGSGRLFALGLVLIIIAVPLQAGAVSATKAVKLSAKLMASTRSPATDPVAPIVQSAESEPTDHEATG
jgi:uncharacterized membrane protein